MPIIKFSYDTYQSPLGTLHIYLNPAGELCALRTQALPDSVCTKDQGNTDAMLAVKQQLAEYFTGSLTVFRVPVCLQGTEFQKAVWATLQRIPYGSTVTYQALAAAIGKPRAVRAVGNAVGANPVLICVPCHRVLPASGKLGGFSCGTDKKALLLRLEGIQYPMSL